jgi:3-hydroxyacyl-CoA dehydrogenase
MPGISIWFKFSAARNTAELAGGPMFWAERQGIGRIITTMQELTKRFGPRYRPAPLLERLVASGKSWYG